LRRRIATTARLLPLFFYPPPTPPAPCTLSLHDALPISPELGRVTQIGTDHGLLRTPVSVPPEGLVLASAEREHQSLRRHADGGRSEEHTSELQSRGHLVCRLLLEKKKHKTYDEQVTSQ